MSNKQINREGEGDKEKHYVIDVNNSTHTCHTPTHTNVPTPPTFSVTVSRMYSLAILLIGLAVTTELTLTSSVLTSSSVSDGKSNSMVGFCDGSYYVPKSRKSCNHGISFGRRAPKCVCIKGIYRMYLSNCEVADGFATEVCTLLEDLEQNITVTGVKMTREFRWDKTALVSEKGSGYNTEWDITGEGGSAHLSAKYFYTVNGDAFASKGSDSKGKLNFCIQRTAKEKNKICLYKHTDNIENWQMEKATTISVPARNTCPEKKGPWTPLKPRKCFDPLDLLDSECQPSCQKTNERGTGGNDIVADTIENANLDSNVTDPRPYNVHESSYLDRKLNTYWMLQETGMLEIKPVNQLEHGPNRTFQLFEIMKNITKNYCPNRFVPKYWVDQVVELFHVLHHGDILKYENELRTDEYQWIHDILTKCGENQNKIPLVPIPDSGNNKGDNGEFEGEHCDFGVKKAMGYCPRSSGICSSSQGIPTPPSKVYADYEKKHYVPEVAWLVLDIVHVICFPQFNESYRMFHLLEQVVEKLFTIQIKNYWYNPSWSTKTKTNMLGMGADVYMWNMEVCAQAAYTSNNDTVHRLVRPDPGKYISLTDIDKRRKKRAADPPSKSQGTSLAANLDVFCPKVRSQFKFPDHCENMKPKTSIHKPQIIPT